MNMLESAVARRNGGFEVSVAGSTIALDGEAAVAHGGLGAYENRPIAVGIRPESLEDAALADRERPRLRGRAELREALGSEMLVHFTVAGRQAVTEDVRQLAEDVGDDRTLDHLAEGAPAQATLVGRFSPQTQIREGDAIEVAVDPRALHFFDPNTGDAIYG
jgi:multiple sugar transport system ATP-binding protein